MVEQTAQAALATQRFGLGARPGEIASIGRDARGFLTSQIDSPASALITAPLPTSAEAARRFVALREVAKTKAETGRAAMDDPLAMMSPPMTPAPQSDDENARRARARA